MEDINKNVANFIDKHKSENLFKAFSGMVKNLANDDSILKTASKLESITKTLKESNVKHDPNLTKEDTKFQNKINEQSTKATTLNR